MIRLRGEVEREGWSGKQSAKKEVTSPPSSADTARPRTPPSPLPHTRSGPSRVDQRINSHSSHAFQTHKHTHTQAPARRAPAPPRAHPLTTTLPSAIALLADTAPGSVDAPVWAVAVGAAVVTAGALLLASGLKGGTEAADQMFDRDRKSGRRR